MLKLNQSKVPSSSNFKRRENSMLPHKLIMQLELEDSKLCNHDLDEYCENCTHEFILEEEEEQDYDET